MASKKIAAANDSITETQEDLVTLDAPPIVSPTTPIGDGYMYFTERDLNKILSNLDTLRDSVYPHKHSEHEAASYIQPQFPSVCLIGLGRCGSNIALDVASLVYNARAITNDSHSVSTLL